LSVSGMANRLVYATSSFNANIWRLDLEPSGPRPGNPKRFIASTKNDTYSVYSSDGRRIAFVSDRLGTHEIWICDSDNPSNAVQLTSIGALEVFGPRWSPDDKTIVFWAVLEDGNKEVFSASVNGGILHRLTDRPGEDKWPSWSGDGKWIYFESDRSRTSDIWKISPEGGQPIRVTWTKDGADIPQESPDGKYLYYCRGYPNPQSLWRIPIGGGVESKVLDGLPPLPNWIVRRDGIYFFNQSGALCFYEFSNDKIKTILEPERGPTGAMVMAISPDGRSILYRQLGDYYTGLMLVENFK
jgi:Tol biopolymer transport system component